MSRAGAPNPDGTDRRPKPAPPAGDGAEAAETVSLAAAPAASPAEGAVGVEADDACKVAVFVDEFEAPQKGVRPTKRRRK